MDQRLSDLPSMLGIPQNTREQIKQVRAHSWVEKEISVRGVVFDMDTGLLGEVEAPAQQSAS
jgi:carbonic anhydrase